MVDDRVPGMGATHASAGMLAPYNEVIEEGPHLDLTVRGLDLFDSFIADLRAEGAPPAVAYRRTGTLTVAAGDEGARRLGQLGEVLRRKGVSAEWLDAVAVRREEPAVSPLVTGGLLIPVHGYVAAFELTRALVAAAQRRGVRFLRTARPTAIRQQGSTAVITSKTERMSAGHVIVAAGAWAGQILVEGSNAPAPVQPVRGQLLHLKASGINLRRATWADHCYLVPWDDGSLLVGATIEHVGFDEQTTAGGMRDLLAGLAEVLTPDWPVTVLSARAGLRPSTPDGLPIIGRSAAAPSVVYATGHYRNGVLLAPMTARLVADLVLERREDPHPRRPQSRALRRPLGMPTITVGDRQFRIRTVACGEGWQAHAVAVDSGHRFGLDVSASTEGEAVAGVQAWLEWQRDHAAALAALQDAERAYHRVLTAHAFGRGNGGEPVAEKRQVLDGMESARTRLDEIRKRQPE